MVSTRTEFAHTKHCPFPQIRRQNGLQIVGPTFPTLGTVERGRRRSPLSSIAPGIRLVPVKKLIEQLARGTTDPIRNADLILPASFGGIERRAGLLDASAPKKPGEATGENEETQRGTPRRGASPPMSPTNIFRKNASVTAN